MYRGMNKEEYILINLYQIGYGANIYLQICQAKNVSNI
jgi:hypothetical protein